MRTRPQFELIAVLFLTFYYFDDILCVPFEMVTEKFNNDTHIMSYSAEGIKLFSQSGFNSLQYVNQHWF